MATIAVNDDALGSETLSLTGPNAAMFEIVGADLRLKAGESLDFETNPVLNVTVNVDDATIPGNPDDSANYAVTINDVNDAPTMSGTVAGQVVTDKTTVNPFSGVTIGDVDIPAQTLTVDVQLDLAAKGTLTTLGGFVDLGGGLYRFSGTTAAATTAIQGLTFDPAENRVAPGSTETTTFSIRVDDSTAVPTIDTTTTVITTSVNDAPIGAGSLTTTILNDSDGATNLFAALTVSDVDAGENDLSLTITLTDPASGVISGGGFVETGPSTGVFTTTALTPTAANTALANATFTPTSNSGSSAFDISVTVNDQGGGGEQTILSPTTLTINGVNDNPTGVGSLTTTSLIDSVGATSLFGGLTVSDPDSGENDLSLTISLSNPTAGTISGGAFNETAPGSGVYTATGLTTAAADAALDAVQMAPTNNSGSSGTFSTDVSVTVNDQGGDGEQIVLPQTTVTITRVNDPPAISVTNSTPSFTENGGPISLFSGTSVAVVDTGDLIDTLQLTIDSLADGGDEILVVDGQAIELIHLNSETTTTNGYGVDVTVSSSTATVRITKSGGYSSTAAEVLIDGLGYNNISESPQGSVRLVNLISIKDDGGTANGGVDTQSIGVSSLVSITPVNDAPTITNGSLVGMAGTDEDNASTGTTISAIINNAGWKDHDIGAVRGMAITGRTGNGTWQYSTDAVAWNSFGSVSPTNALLLSAATQIRYFGDGVDGEIATFGFRAWDTSTGAASTNTVQSYADPGVGGGSSAFFHPIRDYQYDHYGRE